MIGQFRALVPRFGGSGIWLGAVGEILIVTLGVLLAFGLNAWWVESTTRADEQTHLRALERDFEQNVGIYGYLIGRSERSASRSRELLQLARKQPDADPAVVRRLMGGVFQSHREKPALDAYQALVNSAGLALIRDEQLRSDLAGFADRATDPYSERFADQLYMTFITRFIGRMQIAGQVAQDGTEPQPFVELLADSEFQEHLAYRSVVEGDVMVYYCERLNEAQDILEQLRTQVGRPSAAEAVPPVTPPAACAEAETSDPGEDTRVGGRN